ncbi:Hemicentin-2, partial [Armadillidium vulgare]
MQNSRSEKVGLEQVRFLNQVWVTASTGVGEGPSSEVIVVTPTEKVSAGVWSVGRKCDYSAGRRMFKWRVTPVGKPEPKLTWTHAGKPVPQNGQRYSILPDGTLRIIDTQKSDSGTYICTATNIH